MNRRVLLLFAGLLVLVGFGSTVTVGESEFVILERFGDPRRVIEDPGLHLRWPAPIDTVVRIDRRVRILEPERAEYLTSDKKNLLVSSFLVWTVSDPVKFRVSMTDEAGARARLSDIMLSEIGTVLGRHALSDFVSEESKEGAMTDIMDRVASGTATKAEASFGVKVLGFRIRRLTFPAQNLQAVFDRMQAERERIAKQYRSEGQEEAAKIESDARLSEANLLATAKKDAEEVKGAADADATRIYAAAFGKDPDFYRFVRSLETYRKILGANSTLVIPSDSPLLEVMKDPDRFIRKSGAPSPEGGGK